MKMAVIVKYTILILSMISAFYNCATVSKFYEKFTTDMAELNFIKTKSIATQTVSECAVHCLEDSCEVFVKDEGVCSILQKSDSCHSLGASVNAKLYGPVGLTIPCSCPFTQGSLSGSCFYLQKSHAGSGKGYADATVHCQSLGGYLTTIDSADENTDIVKLISALDPGGDFWIGLDDLATEGVRLWQKTGLAPVYTNWYGSSNAEWNDCVKMDIHYSNGRWGMSTCGYHKGYICKLDPR